MQQWMFSLIMRPCTSGRRGRIHHVRSATRTSHYCMFLITAVWLGTLGGTTCSMSTITESVRHNIPLTTTMTADISDTYVFPHHIIPTDLRPDLVCWDEAHKSITLVELAVCFKTDFEEAARRKTAKYLHLVEQAKARGYRSELITLQVGSRGVPDLPGFENLAASLSPT